MNQKEKKSATDTETALHLKSVEETNTSKIQVMQQGVGSSEHSTLHPTVALIGSAVLH